MRFGYPPSEEEQIKDKTFGVDPSYYIDLDFEERTVEWSYYLPLPEGMHWKKGDEMGLGSAHSEKKQSFDEFIISPAKNIPESIHQDIVHHIWRE